MNLSIGVADSNNQLTIQLYNNDTGNLISSITPNEAHTLVRLINAALPQEPWYPVILSHVPLV